MITWMQKHKKWLVITIWISTIAFVGAGFVGWGSYDYNKPTGSVATVGTKEIKIKNLQLEYSNLYNQYQEMFGDEFNKELAEKLNLEKLAYNNLVQKFLLLNLAEDFGISATDEQIAKELVTIPSFLTDGKFDKKAYIQVLKQNRTNPTEFEAQIKKDLTIQKLRTVFASSTNKESIDKLHKVFFASDKVSINIIKNNDISINPTEKDLKAFWEINKNNYKSIIQYKINIEKIALGEDAKKSKNTALKKYLSLKKDKSKFTNTQIIDASTAYLQKEDLDKITSSKIGTILKPIKTKENYIVVQLIEIIEPQVLSYNKVKNSLKSDYVQNQRKEILITKRDKLLTNFKGTDLGYIAKDKIISIDGLTLDESTELVKNIFTSTSVVNYFDMADRTVVYKIFDTKLATYDETKNKDLEDGIKKLKDQTILSSVIEKLYNKYSVVSHMQVK